MSISYSESYSFETRTFDFQSKLVSILKKNFKFEGHFIFFEKLYSKQSMAILVSARRKAEMTKSSSELF